MLSRHSRAASTPASACPTCRSVAGTCIPCSPTPAVSMRRGARLHRAARGRARGWPRRHHRRRPGDLVGFVEAVLMGGQGLPGPVSAAGQRPLPDRRRQPGGARADLGTNAIAHGCTGMGNDQVRFDLAVKAQGDYRIWRRSARSSEVGTQTRAYERPISRSAASVCATGKAVHDQREPAGRDHVGGEIDAWEKPRARGARGWCARRERPASAAPHDPLRTSASPSRLMALDDARGRHPPNSIASSPSTASAAGCTPATRRSASRAVSSEAPGLSPRCSPRTALEKPCSQAQRRTASSRRSAASGWNWCTRLHHDPLKADLEAYLASSQAQVNGEGGAGTSGGRVDAVAVRSPHILNNKGATYAQSADWGRGEAEGFIKLFGMSSTRWAQVNR